MKLILVTIAVATLFGCQAQDDCDSDNWNLTGVDWSWYEKPEIKCLYDCGEAAGNRAALPEKAQLELDCKWKALVEARKVIMEVKSLTMCESDGVSAATFENDFKNYVTEVCKYRNDGDMDLFTTCVKQCTDSDTKNGFFYFIEDLRKMIECDPGCDNPMGAVDKVVQCTCPTFGPGKTKLDAASPSAADVDKVCGDFVKGLTCAKPLVEGCQFLVKALDNYFMEPREYMDKHSSCEESKDDIDDTLEDLFAGGAGLFALPMMVFTVATLVSALHV